MSDSTDKNPRKTSDVLLNIEDKVLALEAKIENLTKLYTNSDHSLKIVISKLNKALSFLEPPKEEFKDFDETNVKSQEEIIQISNVAGPPKRGRPSPSSLKEENKIPVIQSVMTADNRPTFMAKVTVTDMQGNVVLTTTTNTKGSWSANLPKNSYNLKIIKNLPDGKTLSFEDKFELKSGSDDGQAIQLIRGILK